MKNKFATFGVVALIVAGLVVFNQYQPSRVAPAEAEAAEKAKEDVAKADADESRLAAQAAEKTPTDEGTFRVKFECTIGDFTVEVYPKWAPLGAARFKEAVEAGVYNDAAFFRVLSGYIVQFGIPGTPAEAAKWDQANIKDDKVTQSNKTGTLVFATGGPNTRTTQLFINLADNQGLDSRGFAPFGKVVEGMGVVEKICSDYQEDPDQGRIKDEGNAYLKASFPKLDYIKKATIVPASTPAA